MRSRRSERDGPLSPVAWSKRLPPTDHQLLLRMHKGHEPSARLLWERLGRRLVAYARSVLRDKQAAEDAVQGALVRVIQCRRAQLDAVVDVTSWLVTLTRREAVSQLRAHRRDVARRALAIRPEAGGERASEREALAAAVERLPRRQREVLVLKHVAGLTFDQISLALATNRNTAAARYRAGITELRSRVGKGEAIGGGEFGGEQSGAGVRAANVPLELNHG